MIRVYADRQGGRYRLYAEGHAETLPDKELVCAGVSALMEGLLFYARQNPECRHLRSTAEPGRVFLSCRGGLSSAFEMTLCGLLHIAAIYPRDVMVFPGLTTKEKIRDIIGRTVKRTAPHREKGRI